MTNSDVTSESSHVSSLVSRTRRARVRRARHKQDGLLAAAYARIVLLEERVAAFQTLSASDCSLVRKSPSSSRRLESLDCAGSDHHVKSQLGRELGNGIVGVDPAKLAVEVAACIDSSSLSGHDSSPWLSSAACLAAHDPAIAAVKCKGMLVRCGTVSDFDVSVLDQPVVPPPLLQCFADQHVQTNTSSPQPRCFVVVEPLCPLLDAQASTIALLCGRLDALLARGVMGLYGSGSLLNVDADVFVPSGGNGVVGVGALRLDAPHFPRHRLGFIGLGDLASVSSASKFANHVCTHELNIITESDAPSAPCLVLPEREPDCTESHSHTPTSNSESVEDVTPTQALGGVAHDCNQQ